jgi:AcrR family transcriptional regulator
VSAARVTKGGTADLGLGDVLESLTHIAPAASGLRSDTRERLLDAALDSFAQEGFAGTSVRKVCAAVGITPAGLYSHFASKEEIMAAGLARLYTEFLRYVFTDEVDGGGPSTDLATMIRRHMEFLFLFPALAESGNRLLKIANLHLRPESMETVQTVRRYYHGRVEAAVREHGASGRISAARLADGVISLCDQAAYGSIGGPPNEPDVIPEYLLMVDALIEA